MKAKLKAFIDPPSRTLRTYKEDDKRVESRYARAIAYHKIPEFNQALTLIDDLIKDYPADPYFQELKGQILFESSKIKEAIPYYEKAVMLSEDSNLLNRALGRILIESGKPAFLQQAIDNLIIAVTADKSDSFAWRLLAVAYGKTGKLGKSSLALAEEALLNKKFVDARFHSERAASLLKRGTTNWLHAQDILNTLKINKTK
jgi:predicted Zn-dependent protease